LDNLTNRWLVALGVGTVLFALSLFVVRVPVRTIIIFFAIGIPVIFLWLYVDLKSKREKGEIEALNGIEQEDVYVPCANIARQENVWNKSVLVAYL
jgi:hypothetical protein